jgi:hypothetical protein
MELRNLNKTIIPSHKDTTPISRGANSIEPPQALQKNFKITTNKQTGQIGHINNNNI